MVRGLAHLLRRNRLLALGIALVALLFFAHSSTRPVQGPEPKPHYPVAGLKGSEWVDDNVVPDELHKEDDTWLGRLGKLGSPWSSPPRTVLLTGGAGSLGHALIPKLLSHKYTVHVLDIVARPATLPSDVKYHRGSVMAPSTAMGDLLSAHRFDGIIHFAAVSLNTWCEPKADECREVNEGGTVAVMNAIEHALARAPKGGLLSKGKGKGTANPWVVFASSMDVYGESEAGVDVIDEDSVHKPTTALGKTKDLAETAVRDAFARTAGVHIDTEAGVLKEKPGKLRGAIVRLPEVYGYHRAVAIPSAFVRHMLANAITSLPIQYNSDNAPVDLLWVGDAVEGVLRVIRQVDLSARKSETPGLLEFNIVSGGKRWTQDEVVGLVRSETDSFSPVRDLGDHKAPTKVPQYSYKKIEAALGWHPTTSLPLGLAKAAQTLSESAAEHALDFLEDHCKPTDDIAALLGHSPPLVPEDMRNHDLYKLDGCVVNMGWDNQGWMHHMRCHNGGWCAPNNTKVDSYNWDQSYFYVRVDKDAPKTSNGRTTVRFEEQEHHWGFLGLDKAEVDKGGQVAFHAFHPNDENKGKYLDKFDIEVAADKSHLRVMLPGTSQQIAAGVSKVDNTSIFNIQLMGPATRPQFDMRMAVVCCESEGDWPLLLDDHESADVTFGSTGSIPFNSSRRLHLCGRVHDAYKYYETQVKKWRKIVDDGGKSEATTTPLPLNRHPNAWAKKELPPCWNDCSSPTICVQTGNCRCVQADYCPRRRENPLIAIAHGIRATEKDDKKKNPLGKFKAFSSTLADMVRNVDWRDVLLPEARSYVFSHPDFIKVHVVEGWPHQKEVESAPCHKLQNVHCFSADSIIYNALRHMTVPAEEADMIMLPVYQQCKDQPFLLHDVWHTAAQTVPGFNEGKKMPALVLTHDWGVCLGFRWEIWSARQDHALYPDHILDDALVFSVMGDWDSPCYRPPQDVVVPARSCRSNDLLKTFPDVASVRPARERTYLLSWNGTPWGTGKSQRMRLLCKRGGVADVPLVENGGPQSFFEREGDYMTVLGNSRFCPQPKGIAGE